MKNKKDGTTFGHSYQVTLNDDTLDEFDDRISKLEHADADKAHAFSKIFRRLDGIEDRLNDVEAIKTKNEHYYMKPVFTPDDITVLRANKASLTLATIGDHLPVFFEKYGTHDAILQKIALNGCDCNTRYYFLFEDCITKREMNKTDTNKGGFEASDLNRWLQDELFYEFPNEIRNHIVKLSIPTYGMIFGHCKEDGSIYEYYQTFIPDYDKQFELMENVRNRIATFNDELSWYWLQNAKKEGSFSATYFASVGNSGTAGARSASYSNGVRPYFIVEI